jgi:hypothetical protein
MNTSWVIDSVQTAIASSIESWLDQHPTVDWAVSHPLWVVVIFLLSFFLLWGFLKAIAHFAERVWLALFRFPFMLGQWLFGLAVQILRPSNSPADVISEDHPQQKLMILFNRLETIRQEQDDLMREIQAILVVNSTLVLKSSKS